MVGNTRAVQRDTHTHDNEITNLLGQSASTDSSSTKQIPTAQQLLTLLTDKFDSLNTRLSTLDTYCYTIIPPPLTSPRHNRCRPTTPHFPCKTDKTRVVGDFKSLNAYILPFTDKTTHIDSIRRWVQQHRHVHKYDLKAAFYNVLIAAETHMGGGRTVGSTLCECEVSVWSIRVACEGCAKTNNASTVK
eukprot:Lankesteria_metandrocarpae@DN5266_c0_g2_i1.p1